MTQVVALLETEADLDLVRHGIALGATAAVSIGQEARVRPLLEGALALGATRAVRIWDDLLGVCDYLGVAHALAVAIRKIARDFDEQRPFILAGDRGRNAVGPAVAERLSLPHLGQISGMAMREGRTVVRRRQRGTIRLLAVTSPMVLCIDGAPSPSGSAQNSEGRSTEIESLSLADLQLTSMELQHRRHFSPRPSAAPSHAPRILEKPEELITRLRLEGLLRSRGDG